ncbi:uncharacterized protein VP01_2723g1, partial [Puccinia sorghi]
MVNTRHSNPVLTGPLPPASHPKRPKQTKQYKELVALPPLPPSPEPTIQTPRTLILRPAVQFPPIPSPFLNKKSYQFSKSLTSYFDVTAQFSSQTKPASSPTSDIKPFTPMLSASAPTAEFNAKGKFLSKPSKYKSAVE